MSVAIAEKVSLQGGEFIIKDSSVESTFVPEERSEDQKMLQEMTRSFMIKSEEAVHQLSEQARLLEEAGELGLLGAHIPEGYAGMNLDSNTNSLILEEIGRRGGSFNTSFAAHTGIGMLPLLYFGTEEQKQKYLTKTATGEWKAAYCLTEPSSGSDALAAKTQAILTEDETHYKLNGQKMWISNAAFADVLIVFAQVDGNKFTGFVMEANLPGISLGAEEKKLGIKGSSTRQVFFENVLVPVQNVLGEIGKGHLIAFNVLNMGRYKLGNMAMGGCKMATDISVKYANERHQFKSPISSFGAIQEKIGEQIIRTFALESAVYRTSESMQNCKGQLLADGKSQEQAMLEAAEEFAIECSIIKVAGSEYVGWIIDEALQIHGGYGFSEEYAPARAYRDQRINRIYEGTNEINRMLSVNMLLKKAMKGKLDLVGPAWEVQKELTRFPSNTLEDRSYAQEYKSLADFKKLVLMVMGAAAKQQMDGLIDLKNEQEILMRGADLLADTYLAESLLLRVDKLSKMTHEQPQEVVEAILKVFFQDCNDRLAKFAKEALCAFASGDLLKTMLMGVRRFTSYPSVNTKALRRKIANHAIEANSYAL